MEVLVFVTILSLFLIASATISTFLIRQNGLKINMLKAVHYNGQLHEWIKGEKELDWNVFVLRGDANGETYCFTSVSLSWTTAVANKNDCPAADLEALYRRYVVLVQVGTTIESTITTEWSEAGNTYSTKLHTLFTLWGD